MIVISDGKSAKENDYLSRTEEQLRIAGVETVVFDKVEANPVKSTLRRADLLLGKMVAISSWRWAAVA
ncbi:dehydroquinate synthase/iron-containing alcohol dehydrogenase family protein [Carboxydothermus ferrireducens]|uniref:Alcohol dehydrogenase class IV n=1 Tax=Carboxydothermus ferrireducens DSM 11255 TaxID=1119529 RepID=A0ABX2R735_9THEO|nr:alcohol dehydrogenase class IV [Carboxydothermus ferrireducens DSM 11255]